MILSKSRKQTCILLLALLTLSLVGNAFIISTVHGSSNQVVHDTMSEFAPGAFNQTVLTGAESAPEIKLDTNTTSSWFFQDDDISGWTFSTGGDTGYCVAEEVPTGQIHLKAQYVTQHSFAVAMRNDVSVPNKFVAEFRALFDSISATGIADPLTQYPTGASFRFLAKNPTAGFWVDIFTDRILSIWSPGGYVYNTTDYLNVVTNVGTWYTFRFEVDFTTLKFQVYRDAGSGFVWLGQLTASTANAGSSTIYGGTAYVPTGAVAISEGHVDYVKLGTTSSNLYSSGTYTSASLQLNATGFGSLVWTENKQAWPYPWGQWTKYAGNPILSTGSPAENFLIDADNSTPITYGGKYWLVFPSGSGIGLASTTDPQLFTGWTFYPSNPVLSPMAGESSISSPCLVRVGTLYYLFFDVWQPGIWERGLGYATANAPTGPWTRGTDSNGNPYLILTWGPPGSWDDSRVAEEFLFKDGDTFYMYYMGDKQPYAAKEEDGVATTSAADFPLGPGGGNWTKCAGNPVLGLNPNPSSWDHWLTSDPSVIKVGPRYFLHYTGSAIYGGYQGWKMGIAYADSPFGPWTRPSSPTLDVGPPGSWDSNKLVRGCLHYVNGKYYIIYNGESGGGWQQGIATADPYVDQEYVQFETRTSADNTTWEDWKPVLNGSTIQSTPDKYFQYRATLNNSALGSPVLTSVTVNYETTSIATELYVNPPLIVKQIGDVGTTFKVNVTIRDVTDLFGFDFNLTWDRSLLTLMNVEFNTTLDSIWGNGNWFMAQNSTGPSWYELAAVSTASSFSTAGNVALATLEFRVEDLPATDSPIHFTVVKLSDSAWQLIPVRVTDGTYRGIIQTPGMTLNPASAVCRKYNENFTIEINATNVLNIEDFKFEIHYNTTLLDFASADWRAWGTGTVNADEANGNVTGYTSGSLKTGNLTLITLSFRASYYHIWKDCPGWQNNLTGTIYIQWANLSRLNRPDLRYEKGGMNNFTAPPPEVAYVFSPMQGDVNNDGKVDIFDLRAVAAYYDVKQGDANWAEASTYNLKCGETPEIIDIYDLILVAVRYGTTYGS